MTAIRPPFTLETATAKVRAAEDTWNSRDPHRVSRPIPRTRSGGTATGSSGAGTRSGRSWRTSGTANSTTAW